MGQKAGRIAAAAAMLVLGLMGAAHAQPPLGNVVRGVMAEVNARGRAQAKAQEEASAAANLATLRSADEIPDRIRRLRAYRDAVTVMVGALRAAPARAWRLARLQGLDAAAAQAAYDTVRRSIEEAGATAVVRKMQADRAWASAVIAGFELLAANPGRWSPEDSSGGASITITDPAFADRFLEAVERIAEAEKRANAASDAVERARKR